MLIRTFAAVAGLCLVSSAAIAQDTGQPPAVTPVKEKKVCRSMTPTGSIMSRRICLTKAEWARMNAEFEKQNETFRDRQGRGGMSAAQ